MFIEKDVLCGAGVGIGVDGVPPVCGGMSATQSSFGLNALKCLSTRSTGHCPVTLLVAPWW